MPSLSTARRISSIKNNGARTYGQALKEQSDWLMEETWDNDIQSKTCYIYDHFHDDQPDLKDHMTYHNTMKTRIDAKFIVTKYSSIDKDQVEYHLQFKPSQAMEFIPENPLYYYEINYHKRYGVEFPIGLWCDIPDEKGVYRKWLIIEREEGNQFLKYLILPANYHFMWIEKDGQNRIKRKMWGVLRTQNSYNSGIWSDYNFTTTENQSKIWLPLNSITEKIWYTNDTVHNMRVIVSAPIEHPITWQITKVENTKPLGIQKITLAQDFYDQHRDYLEKDSNGNIIGMWADYWDGEARPVNPENPSIVNVKSKILGSTPSIKVGGSYKLLSVDIYDDSNFSIIEDYSSAIFSWSCSIEGIDVTDNVEWLHQESFNKIKIKFPMDRTYLNKLLDVKCVITKDTEIIECNARFLLII